MRIPIADESDVAHVRRLAKAMAGRMGMDNVRCERVSIVATEASRSIVRQAGRGCLLINYQHLGDRPGLARCHAGIIAGVLYRDIRRPNDDVSIVVARRQPRRP